MSRLVVLFLVFAATQVALAQPAVELDQSHVVPSDLNTAYFYGFAHTHDLAQTFTVGKRGTLSAIQVAIERTNPVIPIETPFNVDIVRTIGGVPDFSPAGVLASRSFPFDAAPRTPFPPEAFISNFTVTLDLMSDAIRVAPGDILAIVARSPLRPANETAHFAWRATPFTNNPYPQGQPFTFFRDSGLINPIDKDLMFRTFVLIPEPASLVLFATAGLVMLVRRR